ncbi:hypothetical protein KEM48_010034, partial [Puccinia striiformis f. sp. tritici PST-130]
MASTTLASYLAWLLGGFDSFPYGIEYHRIRKAMPTDHWILNTKRRIGKRGIRQMMAKLDELMNPIPISTHPRFICTAGAQFDSDEDLPVPLDELVRRLEEEEKGRALGFTKSNDPQWVPAGPSSHSNIWPAANPFSPQEARADVTPTLEERASSSNHPVQHAVNYSPYLLHQLEDITNQPGATYFSGDAYQMAADMLYSGPPLGGEDHIVLSFVFGHHKWQCWPERRFLSTWSVSPPNTALPTPPAEQAFLESGNNWHSQSQSGSHQAGGLNCGVSQGNDMREQEAFNPNFKPNPCTHTDDQAQGRSYQEYNMIDLPATGNQSSDIPLQEAQSYGQLNLGFDDYENYELRNHSTASTQPQWQATSNDIPPVSYNGVPSWKLDPSLLVSMPPNE